MCYFIYRHITAAASKIVLIHCWYLWQANTLDQLWNITVTDCYPTFPTSTLSLFPYLQVPHSLSASKTFWWSIIFENKHRITILSQIVKHCIIVLGQCFWHWPLLLRLPISLELRADPTVYLGTHHCYFHHICQGLQFCAKKNPLVWPLSHVWTFLNVL